MNKLILSALVVALTGGSALADRHGGGGHGGGHASGGHSSGGHSSSGGWGGHASGGVAVHNNGGSWGGGHESRGGGGWHGESRGGERRGGWTHENRGTYRGGFRAGVTVRGGWNEPRYYHTHGYARHNIWVNRPVIRTHYYDYGYRPQLYVEDYGAREGYIFVRGEWQWNGYEWIWQPGHYEPDPAYVEVY